MGSPEAHVSKAVGLVVRGWLELRLVLVKGDLLPVASKLGYQVQAA